MHFCELKLQNITLRKIKFTSLLLKRIGFSVVIETRQIKSFQVEMWSTVQLYIRNQGDLEEKKICGGLLV